MRRVTKLPFLQRLSLHRLLGPALCLILLPACSDVAKDSPLSHARTSPEALARAGLEAVRAEDEEALVRLMITRQEYETLLWDELPDSGQMPFDFAWGMNFTNSREARREVLREYGGLPVELVEVDLGDEVEEYGDFTLYLDARMKVRRTDTGEEGLMPLMDVLVNMNGAWKLMNFRDRV